MACGAATSGMGRAKIRQAKRKRAPTCMWRIYRASRALGFRLQRAAGIMLVWNSRERRRRRLPVWPFKRPVPQPLPSCPIDFDLSDDRNTIAQLLKRTITFQSEHPGARSELDLTRVNYLGPFAAAILLANELYSRSAGQPPRIRFPIKPKVKAFLHFSGLDCHFGNGPEPDTSHPENVTVPLRIVQKATWNAADPVIELVRVAIVDRGLGIGTTLAARHPQIQNAEAAITKVVKGGISAQSRPNNMGVGISNLWGHITNPLGGEIFIITEDVMGFSDREGRLRTMPLGVRFAGTGVFFTVPVDR